jgi:hypothetical protein
LQDPTKIFQIGIFGLKNKPSGNPASGQKANRKKGFLCLHSNRLEAG